MFRRLAGMLIALAAVLFAEMAAAAQPYPFTVPPVDQTLDLHGNPAGAQLVVFVAGNQYMVMPALLRAFTRSHPKITRIYYETLPPGVIAQQIAGGGLRMGNLIVAAKPDVMLAGHRRMAVMRAQGYVGTPFSYATNVLAIMIRKGNPKRIRSLSDLGRADIRVSMPNPRWEGVSEQIERVYLKAGGEELLRTIMIAKVANGTTVLTRIHHRQTPMFILDGRADAGPVWISEALYQERIGAPISMVTIPPAQNETAAYEAAEIRNAPHARAAQAFLEFLQSPKARAIYESYGFGPPAR
ncbi:MAG TPA: substrate-binding domain-containing protein [Candidatus Baltobacteraceae bacterium]|nr:substrate-binding domain-containing protein [Candidatus Baltobacteraceae bacterium]